jgi:hypothetical protein
MAIRRINSTGRAKILHEDVRVSVRPDRDGMLEFDAVIDIAGYGLPADASVHLEAQRQTTLMRFALGTVGAIRRPTGRDCRLTEFSDPHGLHFRLKVCAGSGRRGLLLAECDRIPVCDVSEQPDKRIALLPVAPEKLGDEVWRIDYAVNGPLLRINDSVGDWKAVASSPAFRSLVYPAAMREILIRIWRIEKTRHLDDLTDWRCRWFAFAATLPGVGEPPCQSEDDGEWDDWINESVASFARQHGLISRFRGLLASEQSP